jgi:DNA-binding SARP family transcriptional activator/TolB-like protein
MFVLHMFGGVSLVGESGPVSGRAVQRHRLALLALLAASPAGGMSREKLIAYLWPDADPERARHLLSNSLYLIRQALGDAICTTTDGVRLDAAGLRCDVRQFAEALAQGELEAAVRVYAGPFLDGYFLANTPALERWAEEQRERYAGSYAQALEALAEGLEEEGDARGATEWWRKLAAHDRYSSRVALRLMRALAASGNSAGALQHASLYEKLLRGDLEVEPEPEVLALAERLRREVAANGSASAGRGERGTASANSQPVVSAGADSGAAAEAGDGVSVPRSPPVSPLFTRRSRRVLLAFTAGILTVLTASLAARPPESRQVAVESLAVLPLESPSPGAGQDYLASGMTGELITTLSKIEALQVIAHQSVRQFKQSQLSVPEIARLLSVKWVLEGAVLQERDRVLIMINLIDGQTSTTVWSERFERNRDDILLLQREVALAIAARVQVTLSPQDRERLAEIPRVEPEAFDSYIRGKQAWSRLTSEGYREAAEHFAAATAREPEYAAAFAGLALARVCLWDEPEARRAAVRAIELDPGLAEAHVALGLIRMFFDWDMRGAEEAYRRAIRSNPGYAAAHHELSMLLMRLGRFDEALQEGQRTLSLAPMTAQYQSGLAEIYLFSGRYDQALAAANAALALDPNWSLGYWVSGLAYARQGKYDQALEALRTGSGRGCGDCRRYLGHLSAVAGRHGEARDLLATLTAQWTNGGARHAAFEIASIHMGLGQREQALDWLEQAVEPSRRMLYLRVDPTFLSLHAEPRFQALLKEVRLQ